MLVATANKPIGIDTIITNALRTHPNTYLSLSIDLPAFAPELPPDGGAPATIYAHKFVTKFELPGEFLDLDPTSEEGARVCPSTHQDSLLAS
ncbi:MAG: hypothetical protein OXP71_01855 [Candidatus Poribacteria bacterium]|nr:hypothetical protein [Candidatus Poribacteria bacterium]